MTDDEQLFRTYMCSAFSEMTEPKWCEFKGLIQDRLSLLFDLMDKADAAAKLAEALERVRDEWGDCCTCSHIDGHYVRCLSVQIDDALAAWKEAQEK
jgi:hypothetical protein